jgi:putative alpha-1,2-mannosidase
MQFNGTEYTKNYFDHFDLLKGGRIDISMSSQPNTSRGTADADRPYSFSLEK